MLLQAERTINLDRTYEVLEALIKWQGLYLR
jgi:hypothetical protein